MILKAKKLIIEWHNANSAGNESENCFSEIAKSEYNVFIIDYTFKNCIAQLVVRDVGFAPYKNIAFEALAIESQKSEETGIPELIYFYYDSEETEYDSVIKEINNAVNYCIDYIPDELRSKYIGSTGVLTLENSDSDIKIHPDDVENIESLNLCNKPFICIDVQAQYIVIQNDMVTIKVLPILFNVLLD